MITDAQANGKFSATGDEWDEHLDLRASIVGITEGLDAGRPIGWARKGRYEADVLTKQPWKVLADGVAHIPTPTWHRGSKEMRSVDLRWLLLEHPTGWAYLRASTHLPAHLYRSAQRKAHAVAVDGLVPALEPLRKTHGADEVTCGADWNMSLDSVRNRRLLERHGYRVVAPHDPTHGLRVIDGFLTTMHGSARTLAADKGFDHRAVVAELHRDKEK